MQTVISRAMTVCLLLMSCLCCVSHICRLREMRKSCTKSGCPEWLRYYCQAYQRDGCSVTCSSIWHASKDAASREKGQTSGEPRPVETNFVEWIYSIMKMRSAWEFKMREHKDYHNHVVEVSFNLCVVIRSLCPTNSSRRAKYELTTAEYDKAGCTGI